MTTTIDFGPLLELRRSYERNREWLHEGIELGSEDALDVARKLLEEQERRTDELHRQCIALIGTALDPRDEKLAIDGLDWIVFALQPTGGLDDAVIAHDFPDRRQGTTSP